MVQRDARLIASSGSKVAHLGLAGAGNFELKGCFSPQLKAVLQRGSGNVISQDEIKLFRIHHDIKKGFRYDLKPFQEK
jgi:hypothetical protein